MKKIITLALLSLTLLTSFICVAAASDFGVGVETVAEDVKVIKTGLLGKKIIFNDADVKQGLCITDFDKITITRLPKSTEGTLLLAGRRVGEGTTIKRKNLPSLVFIPASREVTEASFGFTVDGQLGGAEVEFVLKFIDKVNYEPNISEEYSDALKEQTQRNVKIYGKMVATDPENDELEYIIVSYPKHGALTSIDEKSGEYLYTPTAGYVGNDSFVYVVRDAYGNFSKTAEVYISVFERMSEVEYTDMENRPEYNAALTLSAMGVMGGRVLGDDVFFDPDETVTRAEFVAISMKALGIKADSKYTSTYFDDNGDIPSSLVGYVATAQKRGIVLGEFKDGKLLFNPNEPITMCDAAVILANIVGTGTDAEIETLANESEIPIWARSSVYTMCAIGVFDTAEALAEINSSLTGADVAECIYKTIKLR